MVVDLIAYICMGLGSFFALSGAIGMLRLPDFFNRLHPAGVIDGMGIPLILLGVIILNGWSLMSGKIFLLILFLWITSPTATHILAKAAYLSRYGQDDTKPKH